MSGFGDSNFVHMQRIKGCQPPNIILYDSYRCNKCECVACETILDTISRNMCAIENRLVTKFEEKFSLLQTDLNSKFQLLYNQMKKEKDNE